MTPPSKPRILLIRPDHLGDTLLTTPAIRALKRAQPDIELHALVGGWSAPLLAHYPELDQILTLPFPGFSREAQAHAGLPYQLVLKTARQLRQIGYDSAVILRPDHWWGALLAHLAGIPHIVGYDLPDVAPFLTDALPFRAEHVVQQNMRLVHHWTGTLPLERVRLEFPVDDADHHDAETALTGVGILPKMPYFCIHAGAGTWVKRWDEAHWAKVADTLTEQLNAHAVFTGGAHEASLVKRITEQMQHQGYALAGDTHVGQLGAIFANAKVVLGADSGPLHVAVAVGTPTVALFGPAKLTEFAPWGDAQKHITLTSEIGCLGCGVLDWGDDAPENHPCIREISVGRVLESARRVAR